MTDEEPIGVKNTDRELWRECNDYYANSIHVTEGGGIGINVGGTVFVKPIEEWHRLAAENAKLREENERLTLKLAETESELNTAIERHDRWVSLPSERPMTDVFLLVMLIILGGVALMLWSM